MHKKIIGWKLILDADSISTSLVKQIESGLAIPRLYCPNILLDKENIYWWDTSMWLMLSDFLREKKINMQGI